MIIRKLKPYELKLIKDNRGKSLKELGLIPDISIQKELEVQDDA